MASNKTRDGEGPQRAMLGWLLGRARPASFWIGLSAGLGIAGGFLIVAQAALFSRIIHRAAMEGAGPEALTPLFLLAAAVVLVRAVVGWGREFAGFNAGAKVREQIRSALLSRLFEAGPSLVSERRSGELASVVFDRTEALHGFFSLYLPQLAVAAAVPFTLAAFVLPVSWAAAGLLLLTAPMIPLFMILVGMGAEAVSQKHFAALERLSAHFLDVLQGLTTLKLFERSRSEADRLARSSEQYRRRTMKVLRIAFLSSAVLEFFASISIALVAVYLGLAYLGYLDFGLYGRSLTLAGGLFVLLLAPDFYLPLRELGVNYHVRAEAVGAAEDLRLLLEQKPSISKGRSLPEGEAFDIRFQDVSFAYTKNSLPLLERVEFTIHPGQKVFLLGASGEGKTTLLHLLLRFFSPDRGKILINGIRLEEFSAEDWRRQVSWVGQEPRLFDGSIRDNIRIGRPEAGDEKVEAAAAAAHVTEFAARLDRGLDAPVGEGGRRLSRGQAQRVALARAHLKAAPILLLDEPTAGLDAETEEQVADALALLCRGKTVLWVTHRLNAAARADRVFFLKSGGIHEGDPEHLLPAVQ
jgi:ATP-binding cassette subfamily C protein CydD